MNRLQYLLNDCLIDTNHVENAALVTIKNAVVAAASAGFHLHLPQAQRLISCFKDLSSTRENGLSFQDKTYSCVRADSNSIYVKTDGHGLILAKTALYIIVATYNTKMYPGVCVESAEKLADYLREKGK